MIFQRNGKALSPTLKWFRNSIAEDGYAAHYHWSAQ
jgi:hypothetical protein